ARETRIPVKGVRKATAAAMVGSAFTAPHVTEFVTVDVTRTMKLVEELKQDKEFEGLRVSPLLLVAKALLVAVKRNPDINASWDEANQEIVQKHYVNLGIAAATPRGLIVPNIKDAHTLTLPQLARALGELVTTAREGRTTPAAMQGGTITITNVGVFGVDTGTPILNPGESAILAVGAIKPQPWVHKGKVKPRQVTTLALSFDHRLVDGELGSKVLADVAVDGIERIRVSYLQPAEMRPGLIDVLTGTEKVAPYFDLSFQHSAPGVLRAMRRFGDTDRFLQLLDTIRSKAPEAGVRSNFIVGFPGETEDDLAELERFLDAARLDAIGVFGYSDEEGTEAAGFDGKLDEDVVAERLERVTRLAEELVSQRAEERIGETVRVLVESVRDAWDATRRPLLEEPLKQDRSALGRDPYPALR
ncbi:2-oxo acid dehydrogenase subunit E2, partial [Streptomyces sp. NPDC002812]|uniref:2-oxo acid dehydrogenase subunit E2 n=1 Tax=Streptomyces sp. NPDC002812 TaxID=3154434 RepID=UPI003324147C